MTPEQISALNAIATILHHVGTVPAGSLLFLLVFGPWVTLVIISVGQSKRFEAVVAMYENNIVLVEEIKGIANGYREQVVYTTQVMTEVKELAENNLHCPIVRKASNPKDIA